MAFALFCLLAAAAEPAATLAQATHGADCSGLVRETMDSGGYPHVKVDCGQEQIWAADPMASIAVGQTLSISKSMPIKGFRSTALDRSFDTICFVSGFGSPGAHGAGSSASGELAEAHEQTGHSPELTDFSGIERLAPTGTQATA